MTADAKAHNARSEIVACDTHQDQICAGLMILV